MELYLDSRPETDALFKTAAFAARLGESPENWPQELTSELYKQLPFLSDYDLNVNLDRVEPQRGFAFGYADVSNKTERPEIEHEEAGLPHIRIPLVIAERAVKPFSVFLDGERVLPLTEERIREVLFNPATFDLSVNPPRDPSLVEALMPPQRSGIGMGGETKMASVKKACMSTEAGGLDDYWLKKFKDTPLYDRAVEVRKKELQLDLINADQDVNDPTRNEISHKPDPHIEAMMKHRRRVDAMKRQVEIEHQLHVLGKPKTASLLRAIAPTMNEKDVEAFTEKVASDPTLISGFKRAGVGELLVDVFEKTKRASSSERLAALHDAIEPTVVTFQKLPGGDFLVKSANVNAFVHDKLAAGQVMPEQEVGEAIGPENAQAMQPGQTATAVSEPTEVAEPKPSKAKVVEEFGQYKVQDAMGNSLMGHVFPSTMSWDGEFSEQPIALFTNGSAYALQDAIAGELIGKGVNLSSDSPRGEGVFYTVKDGEAVCTAPITIASAMAGPDGQPHLMGTDAFGNQVQVTMSEGLTEPMRVSDSEYAMPSTWKFMRLNGQTQLIPDPVQMNKAAAVQELKDSVTLFYNGGFNLTGGCGLGKLASDLRQDMDPVHAEFMLGLLGVEGSLAKIKVGEARRKGHVKLSGLKTIILLSERYSSAEKVASALMQKLPNLRRDLIKEAAALEDEGTVDNLLALNFINPENITTFIGYMPELEATSEKLAEMLLFAYLGAKSLPEGAIDRAMKNLEEVLLGLKAIAHAEA